MPGEDIHEPETPATQRLTNDDFRKLLMTPRAPSGTSHAAGSVRDAMAKSSTSTSASSSTMKPPSSERHEARRKKKNFYAQLKKQEDNKLAELAEKYRDRARERRDGANPDYQNVDASNSTGAYRAVAPDVKSGLDAAERRRQQIQESKFLGGDMEHTHLVKGLDYALLQKVRSEIVVKEQEQEDEMEKIVDVPAETTQKHPVPEKEQLKEDEIEFRTALGKNVHRILEIQRSRHVERNEMFAPGRMAYHIELEDENAETDIPTTVIRSKAEVPLVAGDTQTLTTNDIVINKLAQILSYLRQGGRGKKNKRRDKDKPLFKLSEDKNIDDSIYGDIGEYKPTRRYDAGSSSSKADDSQVKHRYFENSNEQEEREVGAIQIPAPPKLSAQLITKLTAEPEGYAECYPGLQEMNDAIDDSDDEVDYTKMDLGNKKGPIGRWDFDTQEEYSDYMSSKEALPKAAFQYGVKMQDGRKTRKHKTEKNEKAELDREWQQIQNIIHKRKAKEGSSSEIDFKKAKQ
ncbi:protein Red [Toxorhynchites rutilus septentrionalis]|uniref:protein Red n=1 Tax=Toxorhynchites rutilus septentrionalis TaxID=329112 RepID=UPI00247A8970|nr:protein Red [Toxorhynchites rutilus septentrionalis]